jgi:hypothetical protein
MSDRIEEMSDEAAQDADTDNARAYKRLGFNLMKQLEQLEATLATRDDEIYRLKAAGDSMEGVLETFLAGDDCWLENSALTSLAQWKDTQ